MTNLETTKSTLARLLATENLNIEIRKAETAAFNPHTRTLILPLWKDISPELYDLLVGHEVGHALDTPAEGWHDAIVENMKPGFKSFLNVVEDARIERKIKTRYPGLRKSFVIGYRELCEKNFFGLDGKNVNDSLLIDRINVHFKLGVSANVQFKPEEQYFLDKIEATETFEDVYQVAKELYEYCKEEMQDLQQQPQPEAGSPDETGEDFGNSSGDGESSGTSEQSGEKQEMQGDATDSSDSDGEEGGEESSDTDSSYGKDSSKSGDADNFDPVSETDTAFQEAMKSLSQTTGELITGHLHHPNNFDYDNIVVHWKNCVGKLVDTEYQFSPSLLKEFEAKNKNALMYLVKEFEMRKRASELRRVSVAQTGQLDTNKLHTYKFNDDIFRRVASVSQGKNHGLYIAIDWSGSMSDNLKGTIEQLITLTQFCKKINVPFEVMAFATEYRIKNEFGGRVSGVPLKQDVDIKKHLQVNPFNLLNLLSSTMPDKVYRQMCNDLLNAGAMRGRYLKGNFRLGGTPLNETIMVLPKLVNDFKMKNRLQIVNVAILTDGEDSEHIPVNGTFGFSSGIQSSTNNRTCIIIDNETKKSYKTESRRGAVTITLLKILKDKTGCNLLGFYVTQPWRSAYADTMQKFTNDIKYSRYKSPETARESFAKWKETKVDVITDWGFDEYYIIPGGNELNVDDDDLDDIIGQGVNVTARKLRGAFLKMNQNRLTNRVLLRKFIEKVS